VPQAHGERITDETTIWVPGNGQRLWQDVYQRVVGEVYRQIPCSRKPSRTFVVLDQLRVSFIESAGGYARKPEADDDATLRSPE
jgi:hypothetical protein